METVFIIHYFPKDNKADAVKKFVETEIIPVAQERGCVGITMVQDRSDSHLVVFGHWPNEQEAEKFAEVLKEKKAGLLEVCSKEPDRRLYKVLSKY